jgi:hypothetical protein
MPNIVESLLTIVDRFPLLQELPPGRVKEAYELLARNAPTIASEPFMIGGVLLRLARLDYVDIDVMQALLDLEATMASCRHRNNSVTKFAVIADEAGNLLAEGDLKLLMRNVATRLKISEDEVVQILDAAEQETAHVR